MCRHEVEAQPEMIEETLDGNESEAGSGVFHQ